MSTGVGIIGAGPGAGALHAPTTARGGGRFDVVHVSDSGSGRAQGIADRSGARYSTGADELLADPRVDVVVLCGPPATHAEQALAAVAAGKRGVLCEKPLALTHEDVDAVIAACREAGTALIVGTNHLYDPAWERAKHYLVARGERIRGISVTASLPPNDRYHAAVTEREAAAGPGARIAPDWDDPAVASGVVHRLVTGLLVHDVPLLRDLAPVIERVAFARPVPPIGCALGFVASGVPVQVTAVMVPGGADALWRMRIATEADLLEISFPPPFVHAGSAGVEVRDGEGRVISHPRVADDGYIALWRAFADALDGGAPVEYDEIAADAHYAIELADAAAAAAGERA